MAQCLCNGQASQWLCHLLRWLHNPGHSSDSFVFPMSMIFPQHDNPGTSHTVLLPYTATLFHLPRSRGLFRSTDNPCSKRADLQSFVVYARHDAETPTDLYSH